MIICDTEDFCIRSFSKLNKERAENFAKLHKAKTFKNRNDEIGEKFLRDIVDDSIIVKYPKTNELYLTIYCYWEDEKEFHIDVAPINEIGENYIEFHSGTIEYSGNIIRKEDFNIVIECNKWKGIRLNIFMEESNDELAKKLIRDYYYNKYSDNNNKISELENENKRYYNVAFDELILTDY